MRKSLKKTKASQDEKKPSGKTAEKAISEGKKQLIAAIQVQQKSSDIDDSEHKIDMATQALNQGLREELDKDLKANITDDIASHNVETNVTDTAITSPTFEDNLSQAENSPRIQELRRRQKNLAELSRGLTESEKAIRNTHDMLNSINKFFAASEVEMVQFERNEASNLVLKDNTKTLKNQLQDTRQRLLTQATLIDTLESNKRSNQGLLERARKELIHSIEGAKLTTAKLDAKSRSVEKLNSRVEELGEAFENKNNENNQLREKIVVHASEISQLTVQIGKLQKQNEQLELARSILVKDHDQDLLEIMELQNTITTLTESNTNLQSEMETAESELKSKTEDFDIKLAYQENENQTLKSTVRELEKLIQNADEQSVILVNENADLKAKNGIETAKRIDFEKRCIEETEKVSQLEQTLEQYQLKSETLKSQYLLIKSELEQAKVSKLRPALKETPPMHHNNDMQYS